MVSNLQIKNVECVDKLHGISNPQLIQAGRRYLEMNWETTNIRIP